MLKCSNSNNNDNNNDEANNDDEELEEGELKDDDDDDDDDDELIENEPTKGLTNNNNNNNNTNNNNNVNDTTDNRHHDSQPYAPYYSASGGGQPPQNMYNHHPNRRLSPNSQHLAEMHGHLPNSQFGSNSNHNHYRYPPNDGPPMMGPHPMQGPMPGPMYARGGPGGVGPVQKAKCRFYSKTSNKCTWGDHCRFDHRDDSPGPADFDNRGPPPGPPGMVPGPGRGPMNGPPMSGVGPADRVGGPPMNPYPPYPGRHQPYPPPPHGYMYEPYSHHHSTPPPLPPHPASHWRQQHSPYPSQSSSHPAEPVSPALLPSGGNGPPTSASRGPPTAPPGSGSGSSSGSAPANPSGPSGGAPSPGYPPSSSSSAVVYERKHRLAYELAPWNDPGVSRSGGYPPHSRYDRGDPAGYQSRGSGFYRSHYGREQPPYGREPMQHMSGPYPSYPSAYRGPPMGPAMHASQYKYMSSSQRSVPPDARRARSNKRGHDEDESSWSDSGSEDSILGQASYSKSHSNKISKQQHQQTSSAVNPTSDEPLDQGSGTPPGEPLPGEPLQEDRERQEMLLNKLKEIEDLMAKKKGEQEDPS